MGCPDASALQQFVEKPSGPDGIGASAAVTSIRAHLERCGDCRALVLLLTPRAEDVDATLPMSDAVGPLYVPLGQTIGRYVVVGQLGEGGMGVVYAAHDPELDRRVALKLMRRSAPADEGSAQSQQRRLLREAHAMARLTHPNVIVVHDVGPFADGVFIAMELVDGETLGRWLREPRPWRLVLERFLLAGRGLQAAHAAGLVHRDFKPDNVLVGKDGRVRVTDFGLARLTGARASASRERGDDVVSPLRLMLTRTGALIGTPAYMAPEQLDGASTDVRTDVFSFCVALFEGLYRQRPFIGATLRELRDAITEQRVAAVVDRGVPARMRRVLGRGLRADAAERYPDMGALLAAIEEAARPSGKPRLFALATTAALGLAVAAVVVQRTNHDQRATMAAPPVSAMVAPAPHAPSPPAVTPAPTSGTLVVRVDDDRAHIELDGAVIAEAASGARLEVDSRREHRLRVTAPGRRDFAAAVRVGAGAIVDKSVTLARVDKRRPPPAPAPTEATTATTMKTPPAPPADDPNAAIDPYAH